MRGKRQKAFVERSCRSCVLCLTSLLRSIASSTLFPGKKWDRVGRNYYTVIQSQREANKAMLYKGSTGNLKADGTSSGFGTDGSSLFRKKSQVPSNQNRSFFRGLRSNTRLGQAKSAPEQDCLIIRASQKAVGQSGSQQLGKGSFGSPKGPTHSPS